MSTFGQQFGYAVESAWGTIVVPDHFLPLLGNETMEYAPTWGNSETLTAGAFGEPASRAKVIRFEAAGDIPLELSYSKIGALIKQALGSSATATLISGSAYKEVHQIGSTDGKSLTLQLGRNEVSTGTIKPFTYPGAKVESLTIAASDGDTGAAQLTVTTNAKTESTATSLATASYASGAAAGAFTFADVSAIKIGGTAATTSGVIAVTGGTQATSLLNSVSTTFAVPGKTDRYGLGNQGAKSEQINNAMPMVTGSFAGEFTLQSEIYDVWKAGTTVPLQITFTGAVLAGGPNYTFDMIFPAVKFLTAPPHINGYDVPGMAVTWKAYRDDVNGNNMAQITRISSDSAL